MGKTQCPLIIDFSPFPPQIPLTLVGKCGPTYSNLVICIQDIIKHQIIKK